MVYEIKLVSFFIELPEPVGIPDGSLFSFQTSDHFPELEGLEFRMTASSPPIVIPPGETNAIAGFSFWQVDGRQVAPYPFSEAAGIVMKSALGIDREEPNQVGSAPQLYEYKTVVQATTPIRVDETPNANELTAAFDRCEVQLAKLVDGYRVVAPRTILPVRREVLPSIVPYVIHDLPPSSGSELFAGLFLVNHNVPHSPEVLQGQQLEKLRLMVGFSFYGHPFTVYSLRSKEAYAALSQRGDTADAVIRAQMAAEVLLDTILMSMLWEEGVSPDVAAVIFRDEGLSKRVRTHYGSRLGGNWHTDRPGVVADWSTKVHALRGRVVHGNYTPSRDEARLALAALNELDVYIRSRLVAKRTTYKRTTLMLLGRPGLERLGAWSGDIVRFVQNQADNEPDWHASLSDWRQQVNQAR
jgi:hypothetical protein